MRVFALAVALLAGCVPGYSRSIAPAKGKVTRRGFPVGDARVLYETDFSGKHVELAVPTNAKGEFAFEGHKGLRWLSVMPGDLDYRWIFTVEVGGRPVARAKGHDLGVRQAPEIIDVRCDLEVGGEQPCQVTGGGEQFRAQID
jgi:hypothetical protein